jgi:predicted dehydrogenase
MIKVALIGLGHIGQTHVSAISKTNGLELVAGCDQNKALASVLPKNIKFYNSYLELLATGKFDTVVVATSNNTHYSIALDVLSAGYHVIIEKPAAKNTKELDEMEQLALKKRRHIYYALHAASALEVNALTKHLYEKRENYGRITAFHSRFYDPYIDNNGKLTPNAQSLGNCWSDSAVNALSVVDSVLSVDRLHAFFCRKSGNSNLSKGVLSASVGFKFNVTKLDNSGFGLIDTAWDQAINYKVTTFYFGNTGWCIEADHSNQTITQWDPNGLSTELVRFEGNRLLNHYLGVFDDYQKKVYSNQPMNTLAAQRIHSKMFDGTNLL